MSHLKLALSLLIAATICGCASNQSFKINNIDFGKGLSALGHAKDALTEVTQENEIILGQDIATNLLGVAPLLADREVQLYVNRVGRWVSLHSERPDLPWHFAVLDDTSINAFATPGGYVVITKGLLLKLHNEAELAGVLGHEVAHVIQRHHLNALRKVSGMNALSDTASLVLTAQDKNTEVLKLVNAGTELYTRGLDKEDELEADIMGVVLATRAGYDPYGLPAVLQTLQMQNPNDAGLAMLFKTHPSLSDRLMYLDTAMGSGFERFGNSPHVEERFSKTMAGLTHAKP